MNELPNQAVNIPYMSSYNSQFLPNGLIYHAHKCHKVSMGVFFPMLLYHPKDLQS